MAADVAGAALLGLILPNPYPDDTEVTLWLLGFVPGARCSEAVEFLNESPTSDTVTESSTVLSSKSYKWSPITFVSCVTYC